MYPRLLLALFCSAATPLAATNLHAVDLDPRLLGTWPAGYRGDYRHVVISGQRAFLTGDTSSAQGRFEIVDVSDPTLPQPKGSVDLNGPPSGVAISGNYAYIAASEAGLQIVDISNPAGPRRAASLDLPGTSQAVALSGNYAFVAVSGSGLKDPTSSEALFVFNVQDPLRPQRLAEYDLAPTNGPAQIRVATAGNLACVIRTWGGDATPAIMDVLDVSDAAHPQRVGGYQSTGKSNAVAMSGQFALLALYWWDSNGNLKCSLEVVDLSDPANPKRLGAYTSAGSIINDVLASGNTAFLARRTPTGSGALDIIDITQPSVPKRVGGFSALGELYGVAVSNQLACVVGSQIGAVFYNISNPVTPQLLGSYVPSPGIAWGVAGAGQLACLADGPSGLTVLDISHPTDAIRLGGYNTTGSGLRVAVAGKYAYVADELPGLQVIDVGDPANPRRVGGYNSGGGIMRVAVSGDYAFLGDVGYGLIILSITNPVVPRRVGGHASKYDGVTIDVAVSGDYAYVTSDSYPSYYGALEIFDVSSPNAPVLMGAYEPGTYIRSVAVSGKYVALTEGLSAGPPRVEILDVTDPANPTPIGSYDRYHDGTQSGTLMRTVTLVGSTAYVTSVGREIGGIGAYVNTLDILDISDPTSPRRVGGHNNLSSGFPFATVSGQLALFADATQGLRIMDVSRPATLNKIGAVKGSGDAVGVALAGNRAFVAEAQGSLSIIDVTDPASPQTLGSTTPSGTTYAVAVAGDRVFLANGESGLGVYDASDPANPQYLGGFDTPGQARGVVISGNTAFVADGTSGVQVLDVGDPANIQMIGTAPTTGVASSVTLLGSQLLVGQREGGLLILDVSVPASPVSLAEYNPGGYVVAAAVSGTLAYIADGSSGFQVLDLTNPAKPTLVGNSAGGGYARGIAVSGRFVYVTDALSGVQVYDVADPVHPRLIGGNSALDAYGIAVAGGKVFAVGGTEGLGVFEAFTPPLQLGIAPRTGAGAIDLRVDGPPQMSVRLQRSSDLTNWQDWQTLTLGAMPTTISDPTAGSDAKRFYRAVSP